jgi:hypothetical protein
LNAQLARGILLAVIFPSNKYNNGRLCLWQGLLIVLVPMIVYIAKRVIIFVPKFTEKSPFLNAQLVRGALSAVSFSLQMSTTMAIHAYGKDCLLF